MFWSESARDVAPYEIGEEGVKEDMEADFCVTSLRDAGDLIVSENSSQQSGTNSR